MVVEMKSGSQRGISSPAKVSIVTITNWDGGAITAVSSPPSITISTTSVRLKPSKQPLLSPLSMEPQNSNTHHWGQEDYCNKGFRENERF